MIVSALLLAAFRAPARAATAVTDLHALDVPFERIDSPALSPRADRVVFSASAEDGSMHLFVMPTAGGAVSQITSGPGDDWSATFSPDGSTVAFVSNRGGNRDLWTVPATGGDPRRVTSDPADDIDPCWSPDGTRLAFASSRGGSLLLYQVTLSDNQVYLLTAGTGQDRRPAWSPDGRLIAFESTRSGRPQVWLIPPEGGEASRVGRDDGREESWPAWMPGGHAVLAHVSPPQAPGSLWILPIDDAAAAVQVPLPPAPGAEPGQGAPPPSLSRDGRGLVYVGGGEASIEVMAITGGSPTTIVSSEGRLRHPSWSPEGRRLVLAGDLGGAWDLWIAGISSGRLARLTSDDAREEAPVWSAESGDVLYATDEAGVKSVHMIDPVSKRTIRFSRPAQAAPASDTDPAWSPDGLSVAFVSDRAGSPDIYIAPSGGGEARRLTRLPGAETHPTWSPDGKWIAFARDQGGGSEIWKMPAEGGDPVRLTRTTEGILGDTLPAWSPAGTWIAFSRALADPPGASDLYILPPDGGRPFPLRRGLGARILEPAWAPDGGHIAYAFSRPDRLVLLDLGEPLPPGSAAPAPEGGSPPPGTPEGLQRMMEQQRKEQEAAARAPQAADPNRPR